MKKTMQPCDVHWDKLQKHFDLGLTVLVQPKIDGVKAININGKLKGRSLKPLDNKYVTEQFSKPEYEGFEGEMILGSNPTLPDLCRDSSSALRRIDGQPVCTWCVFDYTILGAQDLGYHERIRKLDHEIRYHNLKNVEIVRGVTCETMQEVLDYEEQCLRDGFEGICIRDTSLPYKQGRCGKTFMGVWRVKRFIDAEARIIRITEGNHNANEAKTNELGRTARSSHQENLIPNGLLGNMEGELLEDLKDPQTQEVLVKKGTIITISPGEMDHNQRKFYFENQDEIVGKVVKFKSFPKGLKDKPRFPIFLSIREEFDLAK